jgi:hypothetical protein
MLTAETLQSWVQQKAELEAEYPYLSYPSPDLKKSQIFVTSIDELRDDHNPYVVDFMPATLEEGRNFEQFLRREHHTMECL